MKKLLLVLTMALVALGGGTIHLWRQIEAGQQRIADLQQRVKAMGAAQQAAAATFARQMAAANPAAPQAANAPVAPGSSATATASTELGATLKEQLESPEFKERVRTQIRAMRLSRLPDLGKELNLSAKEIDALLDLLEQQESRSATIAEEIARDATATAQQKSNRREALWQTNEAEFAALLGSKYPQWKVYNDTLTGRRQVTDLRAVLDADNNPLTDTQARQLIAAVGAEHQRIYLETRDALARGADAQALVDSRHSPEKTQRLIAAATPLLSPRQVEGYRQMLEREERTDAGDATPGGEFRRATTLITTPGKTSSGLSLARSRGST